MSLFENLGDDIKNQIFKNSLDIGNVFLKKFDKAAHQKLFIIAGLSSEKVFICSVFINSEINRSLLNKPQLLKLQIPLLKSRNIFFKHDSFANCSYPIPLNTSQIINGILNSSCKVIGNINNDDLKIIQETIINSGLLTDVEIDLYFKT